MAWHFDPTKESWMKEKIEKDMQDKGFEPSKLFLKNLLLRFDKVLNQKQVDHLDCFAF